MKEFDNINEYRRVNEAIHSDLLTSDTAKYALIEECYYDKIRTDFYRLLNLQFVILSISNDLNQNMKKNIEEGEKVWRMFAKRF